MTRPHPLPTAEGPYPPTEGMLNAPVSEAEQERGTKELRAAWKTPEGWRYVTAVNNSEVGKWYSLTALAFMLVAGLLALALSAKTFRKLALTLSI